VRYLGFAVVAVAVYRAVSYARYNWNEGNKPAAAGALLIALLTFVFPIITSIFVDSRD
jgi:heme/copper-type cytochrome/quinol oxidase subunit 2